MMACMHSCEQVERQSATVLGKKNFGEQDTRNIAITRPV